MLKFSNFTLGPVQMFEDIQNMSSQELPYFRGKEFSSIVFEDEELIKTICNAPTDSRVVFLTSSGTGAMEAAISNILNDKDKCLVVNGGTFGSRICKILDCYNILYDEIKIEYFQDITLEILQKYDNEGYTHLLINKCETSTGVLYDMDIVSDFCKRNHISLIVDNISSFLSDSFDMNELSCDVMIGCSQKALSCYPGISFLVLSQSAIEKICRNPQKSFYFDLKEALSNSLRGQTPWTPNVLTLLQMNCMLKKIQNDTLNIEEHNSIIANDFRDRLKQIAINVPTAHLSNSLTPIWVKDANYLADTLRDNYNILINKSSIYKDNLLRVGHMGNLTVEDNKQLIKKIKHIYAI